MGRDAKLPLWVPLPRNLNQLCGSNGGVITSWFTGEQLLASLLSERLVPDEMGLQAPNVKEVPNGVPAAPLPVRLLANVPWNGAGNGPSTWGPAFT